MKCDCLALLHKGEQDRINLIFSAFAVVISSKQDSSLSVCESGFLSKKWQISKTLNAIHTIKPEIQGSIIPTI